MDYYYNISGVFICISNELPINDTEYEMFKIDSCESVDIYVKILSADDAAKIDLSDAEFVFKEGFATWYKTKESGMIFKRNSSLDKDVISIMKANSDFSYIEMSNMNYKTHSEESFFGMNGEILFRNYLIYRGGMVIHGVSINHNGEAILFSGYSGAGKTTQADLWIEHEGSYIINGDRTPLVFSRSKLYTLGSAWSGSSGIYKNERVPVKAIVFLEQTKQNNAVKLEPSEALLYMLPRCFLPCYDKDMMDKSFENVDRIMKSTDIYLLQNNADKECVGLLKEMIYG